MEENIGYDNVSSLLIYNDVSGTLIWRKFRNQFALAGSIAGNPANHGYIIVTLYGKHYLAHRLVWLLNHGRWPEKDIDHIDHNKNNNKIENLREVDQLENSKNVGITIRNTSGVVGVYWRKDVSKWTAKIRVDGVLLSLGSFNDKMSAVQARKMAEIKYGFHLNHGQSNRRNAQCT